MRNLLSTVCAAALLFSPVLQAQNAEDMRYYDIEVLIFENLDERWRNAEQWPADINREVPEQLIELDQPLPGPIPEAWHAQWSFKSLAENQLQFAEISKLIDNADRYRILMHRGWRQPGLDKAHALPVQFAAEYTPAGDATPVDTASPLAGSNSAANPPAGKATLDGHIRIILSRYLHADVDLAYTTGLREATPSIFGTDFLQPEAPAPTVYRLRQTRRMRSGELHYLDHPALGMLIQITPVEETPPPQ